MDGRCRFRDKLKEEGIEILSFTSDILKSRGLAWNTSKTDIYTSQKAQIHFLIDENKYLDSIDISVGERL